MFQRSQVQIFEVGQAQLQQQMDLWDELNREKQSE